jgi:hypothetical protein
MSYNFSEYSVTVKSYSVQVFVAKMDEDVFICLFNKNDKEFMNDVHALGFTTFTIQFENRFEHFYPILFVKETQLTDELCKDIWEQIFKKGLPAA